MLVQIDSTFPFQVTWDFFNLIKLEGGISMKKDMRSFNKGLTTFFIIFFVSFGIYSIAIKDNDYEQSLKWNDILSNKSNSTPASSMVSSNNVSQVMDKLVVFQEESYDKVEANNMISRLEKIPYSMLEELADENIKIILSNTNITEVEEYEHLKGVTPRGWEGTGKTWDDVPGAGGKAVVARIGYSEPSEAHGAINLELHETAHAIDEYVLKDISSSKEFKKLWKQEVSNIFGENPYFVDYPEEYFAETFAMYYLNEKERGVLRDKAPLTYEFISNLE